MISKTQTIGTAVLTVQYSYDAQGHLDSMIYPDGTILSYNHDTAGRINGADVTLSGGSAQTLIQNINYLPFGPISQFDYAGAYPDQDRGFGVASCIATFCAKRTLSR